tara:strand:+ start:111 stop:425 length:315 start_codon:yes stop_codon:yes gene_type:complete
MESKNHKHTEEGMLIGEYVQKIISQLFRENKIYETDLVNLQKQEYCKIKFDLNYPMFKKSSESRFDDNGYARYYEYEITPGYWLTNDWYEKHWDYFLKWERNKR